MTAQRHLQPAAKSRSVQRRNDRLGRILDTLDDRRQERLRHRLSEFPDVRPGNEGAAGAKDHRNLCRRVRLEPLDRLLEAGTNRLGQGVDGRIVDRNQGDLALERVGNRGVVGPAVGHLAISSSYRRFSLHGRDADVFCSAAHSRRAATSCNPGISSLKYLAETARHSAA